MPKIDLMILTALDEELNAVLEVLRNASNWYGETRRFGPTTYLYRLPATTHDQRRIEYTVVVASDYQMGGERMAQFAAKMFRDWSPRAAILTGIAAAADTDDAKVGDVVVASQVFSYSNIAVIGDRLVFRKGGFQTSSKLRRAANDIRAPLTRYRNWQRACIGAINAIVRNFNAVRRKNQKIIRPQKIDKPQIIVVVFRY
jgi:nucleoside phosphorylase